MATKKEAGAGRGFVNPKPVNVSEEDYVTPKQQYDAEMEAKQRKLEAESTREYNKATKMKSGGSASSRADGCCARGKTRGKMV